MAFNISGIEGKGQGHQKNFMLLHGRLSHMVEARDHEIVRALETHPATSRGLSVE